MLTRRVSRRGQVTLPAAIRRQLGIEPGSRVEIRVEGDHIAIRRVKTISELAGIFRKYADRVPADWDSARTKTEESVADQAARE